MNNKLAEIIGDLKVAKQMGKLDENRTKETRHFMGQMNAVLETFQRLDPIRNENDQRLDLLEAVLKDLQEWEKELNDMVNTNKIQKKGHSYQRQPSLHGKQT